MSVIVPWDRGYRRAQKSAKDGASCPRGSMASLPTSMSGSASSRPGWRPITSTSVDDAEGMVSATPCAYGWHLELSYGGGAMAKSEGRSWSGQPSRAGLLGAERPERCSVRSGHAQ